jgi:hypothetical protein
MLPNMATIVVNSLVQMTKEVRSSRIQVSSAFSQRKVTTIFNAK